MMVHVQVYHITMVSDGIQPIRLLCRTICKQTNADACTIVTASNA